MNSTRLAGVPIAFGLLLSAGCANSTIVNTPAAVPAEVINYADALNARSANRIAELIWFPGPQWPSVAPVPATEVPAACIQSEIHSLGGKALNVTKIHMELRNLYISPGSDADPQGPDYEIAWFSLPDGSLEGRQVAEVEGRTLIVPAWSGACNRAAVSRFGDA